MGVIRAGLAAILGLAAFGAALGADSAQPGTPGKAKNLILMVADGAGFNTWRATELYNGEKKPFYRKAPWVSMAVAPSGLSWNGARDDHGDPLGLEPLVYDPERAWDPAKVSGEKRGVRHFFEGYRWRRTDAPDSANTASALVTGVPTFSGAINIDGDGNSIERTLAWLSREAGKRAGIVSSVQFTHATPAAAGGAHNRTRRAYCELAAELLTSGLLHFIAGAGNPDFDNNGQPLPEGAERTYRYVGGREIWEVLTGERPAERTRRVCADGDGGGVNLDREARKLLGHWTLLQDKQRIESLAEGATPPRVLIVPQVGHVQMQGAYWVGGTVSTVRIGGTLQQARGSRADARFTPPGFDPRTESVPSLATLTQVALNALDDDPDGFFLHVEGGAVDWAMHANQLGRTVEEMNDFVDAIEAVVAWVDARDAWDETLLVVTADHDHMLWGPNASRKPFDKLVDKGKGKLPGYRWLSSSHSRSLIPVFARGAGAGYVRSLAKGKDPVHGPYVEQIDLFKVMSRAAFGE